jgi:hypothetical protein
MWKCKECGDEIEIVTTGKTYTLGKDGELIQTRAILLCSKAEWVEDDNASDDNASD